MEAIIWLDFLLFWFPCDTDGRPINWNTVKNADYRNGILNSAGLHLHNVQSSGGFEEASLSTGEAALSDDAPLFHDIYKRSWKPLPERHSMSIKESAPGTRQHKRLVAHLPHREAHRGFHARSWKRAFSKQQTLTEYTPVKSTSSLTLSVAYPNEGEHLQEGLPLVGGDIVENIDADTSKLSNESAILMDENSEVISVSDLLTIPKPANMEFGTTEHEQVKHIFYNTNSSNVSKFLSRLKTISYLQPYTTSSYDVNANDRKNVFDIYMLKKIGEVEKIHGATTHRPRPTPSEDIFLLHTVTTSLSEEPEEDTDISASSHSTNAATESQHLGSNSSQQNMRESSEQMVTKHTDSNHSKLHVVQQLKKQKDNHHSLKQPHQTDRGNHQKINVYRFHKDKFRPHHRYESLRYEHQKERTVERKASTTTHSRVSTKNPFSIEIASKSFLPEVKIILKGLTTESIQSGDDVNIV